MYGSHHWRGWVGLLPVRDWPVYRRVLEAALDRRLPFALGGALATATHTGQWRGTHDMDVYVEPSHRAEMIAMLDDLGLQDIQCISPYDDSVTYRASDNANELGVETSVIVEIISGMKNHRAMVDALWLSRAEKIDIDGMKLRVTAPEEMIWPKLYVLSRERCDWPDVLNMLYFCGAGMDWEHLLQRLGPDAPLLTGVLAVLSWLSPQSVREFPDWLLPRLDLRGVGSHVDEEELRRRSSLLKFADWFGIPLQTAEMKQNG